MQTLGIEILLGKNLKAELKFRAPVICSVRNLQMFVRELQLPDASALPFYAR